MLASKSCIHLPSARAYYTVRQLMILVCTVATRSSAISTAATPWIHLSLQNNTFSPDPTVMSISVSNTYRASLSSIIGNPCQGHCGSVLLSHSHLTLSAIAWLFKFSMPSPPNLLGRHMVSHATRHCPPLILSFPAQKKDLIHLLISSNTQSGASAIIR